MVGSVVLAGALMFGGVPVVDGPVGAGGLPGSVVAGFEGRVARVGVDGGVVVPLRSVAVSDPGGDAAWGEWVAGLGEKPARAVVFERDVVGSRSGGGYVSRSGSRSGGGYVSRSRSGGGGDYGFRVTSKGGQGAIDNDFQGLTEYDDYNGWGKGKFYAVHSTTKTGRALRRGIANGKTSYNINGENYKVQRTQIVKPGEAMSKYIDKNSTSTWVQTCTDDGRAYLVELRK